MQKQKHFWKLSCCSQISLYSTSLYSKLSAKLNELRKTVAADIYNEGKCVPCMKKVNEGKKHDSYEDCVEFYMDAKDYSQEDARRECGHQKTAGNILDEE